MNCGYCGRPYLIVTGGRPYPYRDIPQVRVTHKIDCSITDKEDRDNCRRARRIEAGLEPEVEHVPTTAPF